MNVANAALHSRNMDEANARTVAAGRCVMHNLDVDIPASWVMELPIGNVITLCIDCHDWWLKAAAESGDPMSQPVSVRKII